MFRIRGLYLRGKEKYKATDTYGSNGRSGNHNEWPCQRRNEYLGAGVSPIMHEDNPC